jgi:hypothetical protein
VARKQRRIKWNEIREYAVTGARARLQEILAEAAKIVAAFPQLGAEGGVPAVQAQGAASTVRRTQRRMSAAQRKAVSERMRKYWEARRRSTATPEAQAGAAEPAAQRSKTRATRKKR